MPSGSKAAGTVRTVSRKTTTTASTPAKEAGVELQDSGEETSEGDDSVDGEEVIDMASINKQFQKQIAKFLAAQPQKRANVAQAYGDRRL